MGDNTELDIKDTGCEDMEWIHLAQNRVQWQACKHSNKSSGSTKSTKLCN